MAEQHRAGLSARQREYVLSRLEQARQPTATIPRLPAGTPVEPSFAQERLWFLEQLEPNTALYCRGLNLRIHGELDADVLERSLRLIVQRHAPLRTTFVPVDGRPVLAVRQAAEFSLRRRARLSVTDDDRAATVRELAIQEISRPFDLARDLMLRAMLVQLAESDHILLLTTHHITTDGWSDGVLLHELSRCYAAFVDHRPVDLPAPAVEYADYAAWQRQRLQGEVLERQLAYWRQQLAHVAPLLLPTDRPRPAVQGYGGALASFAAPAQLTDKLRALSRQAGVTLYMTLLAAFQVLLARYTGQDDIAVGSPIANRPVPELEPLIGYFANTLVLRTDLSGDPTFDDLLQRVRRVALGAYAHQETPFEKLVEALRPDRSLSQNPLFQVLFALQNVPGGSVDLPGLTVERLPSAGEAAKFDLSLSLHETAAGLAGHFEYRTDIFDAPTMERMAGHFLTLLDGVVADPGRRISDLPLLTAGERRQLLVDWNRTRVDWPALPCVHQLVADQARRTPDAIAVTCEGRELSYGELEARAGRLAHMLRQLGAAPGKRVALFLERSLDMVVAILGVLKAGCAYVPLDPSHPRERIDFVLADSQPAALVTQRSLAERLPAFGGRTLCMDADAWPRADHGDATDDPLVGPGDPAYVLYTSGSTGRPKGVQTPHGALSNYVLAVRQVAPIRPTDVMPALATYTFDVSVEENLIPLTAGACVAIASRAVAADGQQLAAFLTEVGATIIDATPATWRLLLAAGWQTWPDLRLLSGGEELPRSLAEQLMAHGAALWNLYGPTETTIFSTIARVTPGEGPVSIGRPIANTQVYILDSRGQPAPIGVAGELVIGGAGLALGYLGQPRLTAEKFVPHPFTAEVDGNPGARLYRTGDLARYRPDGSIEYLGRTDFQVKLRGHRIELGEIEAVLAQHPGVRECVVTLAGDTLDDRRLVAYWILRPGQAAEPDDLRRYLRTKLPDYMAPAMYAQLDAWPLTSSGKIDRRALPHPELQQVESISQHIAPRSPTEAAIAAIWSQVLGNQHVGVEDDFFWLGGHSLAAARVVARIQSELGVTVPLRALFEQPTVAGLARLIVTEEMIQMAAAERVQLIKAMESP